MSTNTTPGNQTPGTDEMYSNDDLRRIARSRPEPLGIDAQARRHHHATTIGPVGVSVVWVMDENNIVHDRVLIEGSNHDLATWVAFIDTKFGWETCNYDDRDWGEWLVSRLKRDDDDGGEADD